MEKKSSALRIRNNKDSVPWDPSFAIDYYVEDRLGPLWGVASWSLWQL